MKVFLEDSRLPCVKFHTIAFNQKKARFQYGNNSGLCTLLPAVRISPSLFIFIRVLKKNPNWKKQKKESCFTSANLETICDSSSYGQLDINPFYLYPRRKLSLVSIILLASQFGLSHSCLLR